MLGTIIGTIAIVLITIAVGLLVDRKVSFLPKPTEIATDEAKPPPPTHGAGEAPATAIRARVSQVAKLRKQRCPQCRAEMSGSDDDTVRYGDRELLVLHFTCPACSTKRVLYVEQLA